MSTSDSERIVVAVHDSHLKSIGQVADNLRQKGMQVDKVLPTIGIITGRATRGQVAALTQVEGVANINPDEEMRAI